MIIEFFEEQKVELTVKYKSDFQYPPELNTALDAINGAIAKNGLPEECQLKGGDKRPSTRGRRVVKKRQTKRNALRKRNKRTIKHKRKKHRTVKRGARK
jgi:hypothetical protein